jgi:hypothetical protein
MTYDLTLKTTLGRETHQFTVAFDDRDEVTTTLASPLLSLMVDVIEQGIATPSLRSATPELQVENRERPSKQTVADLRDQLDLRRHERLWAFCPPVDVMPIDDVYNLAAALNDSPLGGTERPEELSSLVVLLASAQIGKDVNDLAAYTGLPNHEICEYATRLWENGVWLAGEAYWPALGNCTILVKDPLVADGLVIRVPGTLAWTAASNPSSGVDGLDGPEDSQ